MMAGIRKALGSLLGPTGRTPQLVQGTTTQVEAGAPAKQTLTKIGEAEYRVDVEYPRGPSGDGTGATDGDFASEVNTVGTQTRTAVDKAIDVATAGIAGAVQVFAHRFNENWTVGLADSNFDTTAGGVDVVGTSLFEQVCAQSGQVIARLYNAGVAEDRLGDMLARLETDVLSKRPDRVLHMGGTNNVTSSSFTVENMAPTAKAIWDEITGRGVALAVVSIPPVTSTAQVRQKAIDWNTWQATECARRGIPFVDIHTALSDGNGDWAPGMNRDGLHFSPAGAELAGRIIVDALEPYWKPESPIILAGEPGDTGNLIVNPQLAQSLGAGYPDYWNASRTAGTITAIPDPEVHGNWARFTRTAATGALNAHYRVATGFTAGEDIELAVKVRPPAGNKVTYTYYVTFENAAGQQVGIVRPAGFWTTDNDGDPMVLYARALVPAGTTVMRHYLHTSAGIGHVDFAQPTLRKRT